MMLEVLLSFFSTVMQEIDKAKMILLWHNKFLERF